LTAESPPFNVARLAAPTLMILAMPSKRAKEIALAFPRGAHQEVLINGVLRHAVEHDCNWSYVTAPESLALSVLDLRGWRGDGIIAAINTPAEAACVRELPMPVVNISGTLANSPVPRVSLDNAMVGRMAAAHLIERGFEEFAYYGLQHVAYSTVRHDAFSARLTQEGFRTATLLMPPTYRAKAEHWRVQQRKLLKWLGVLPTPIGLFAVTDYRAQQVLDACRQVGLRVPQQVAVVGVDNEEVICAHVQPPLTSVARNNQQEGYHAAAMLNHLIRGKPVDNVEEWIPPLGVVARESTETVAFRDPRLREAIEYLNQHIGDPINVQELASHVGVSRRWMEYAFRAALGESPYQYLRHRRLELAQHLLEAETTAKIHKVARRTGFTSAKQLSVAFCQEFGCSPREYQRRKNA
jgi:LacI family transcriptional regulator